MEKTKHKHKWTSSGSNYYHIGGTRLWLFRNCRKCHAIQDAKVDTIALIQWREYKITFPKGGKAKKGIL